MSGPEAGAPRAPERPAQPRVMINLRFELEDGSAAMIYDVFPDSQAEPVRVPKDASSVSVWLGVRG